MTSQQAPHAEIDSSTLASAQRGDDAACLELVRTYERRVFAMLSRTLGGRAQPDRIEDLAQETFLKTFRALRGFSPSGPAKLSTWILTIATRVALDEARRPVRLAEPPGTSDPLAHESADELAQHRSVLRTVDSLSPDQRAVFVLYAFHDFSYEEIADALRLNLGTVKSRLARARMTLREALKEAHHG